MNALPNTSALIIGHADQRGDSLTNYESSEQRALAVKNYVASDGIALDRLSSRAVGETDLLTLDDDAAALALNRRTEFVLYGLLCGLRPRLTRFDGRADWEQLCRASTPAPRRKDDIVSGEGDQAKGKIKQAVGDLTDDNSLKSEGKVDEAAGKVKEGVDKVKDKLTGND